MKGIDFYICAGCGGQVAFEDAQTVIPFSHAGKQMMQGYIHCRTCAKREPMMAWKQAHERENPHRAGYPT